MNEIDLHYLAKTILSTPIGVECFFCSASKTEETPFRYGAIRQILFDSEVLTLNIVSGGSPWISEISNDPDLNQEERTYDTLVRYASFNGLERFFADECVHTPHGSEGLLSQQALIDMLEEYGGHDRAMSHVRDYYEEELGSDPIWRYPISLDTCNGGFIVPVKEGYLFIPYDEIDAEDYEILMLDKTSLLDAECCDFMAVELRRYADALGSELRSISRELNRCKTKEDA